MKLLSQILTGIDLPCEAQVGRRLLIEHFGGIIISGDTVLGNRVDVGTGAKILGAITIGDDVAIGANAVVLQDVPPNCLAVGVSATIKPRKSPPAGG